MNSLERSYMEPCVSIGLPVYNGERFIREAIESVLNQTFKSFELIISDNASTYNTGSIYNTKEGSDALAYINGTGLEMTIDRFCLNLNAENLRRDFDNYIKRLNQ